MIPKFSTLAGLKSVARMVMREKDIPLNAALELVARSGGFGGFKHARVCLSNGDVSRNEITIWERWRDWEVRDFGDASISISINQTLKALIRPHNFAGYLGGFRFESDNRLGPTVGMMRQDKQVAINSLTRAANSLKFSQATGLLPSSGRNSCYPSRDWKNRPPMADHDTAWFDPVERKYVLMIEPYPRSADERHRLVEWQANFGWVAIPSTWGSLYQYGTQLILCCPLEYAPTLRQKVAKLEASQSASSLDDVLIHNRARMAS